MISAKNTHPFIHTNHGACQPVLAQHSQGRSSIPALPSSRPTPLQDPEALGRCQPWLPWKKTPWSSVSILPREDLVWGESRGWAGMSEGSPRIISLPKISTTSLSISSHISSITSLYYSTVFFSIACIITWQSIIFIIKLWAVYSVYPNSNIKSTKVGTLFCSTVLSLTVLGT